MRSLALTCAASYIVRPRWSTNEPSAPFDNKYSANAVYPYWTAYFIPVLPVLFCWLMDPPFRNANLTNLWLFVWQAMINKVFPFGSWVSMGIPCCKKSCTLLYRPCLAHVKNWAKSTQSTWVSVAASLLDDKEGMNRVEQFNAVWSMLVSFAQEGFTTPMMEPQLRVEVCRCNCPTVWQEYTFWGRLDKRSGLTWDRRSGNIF